MTSQRTAKGTVESPLPRDLVIDRVTDLVSVLVGLVNNLRTVPMFGLMEGPRTSQIVGVIEITIKSRVLLRIERQNQQIQKRNQKGKNNRRVVELRRNCRSGQSLKNCRIFALALLLTELENIFPVLVLPKMLETNAPSCLVLPKRLETNAPHPVLLKRLRIPIIHLLKSQRASTTQKMTCTNQ